MPAATSDASSDSDFSPSGSSGGAGLRAIDPPDHRAGEAPGRSGAWPIPATWAPLMPQRVEGEVLADGPYAGYTTSWIEVPEPDTGEPENWFGYRHWDRSLFVVVDPDTEAVVARYQRAVGGGWVIAADGNGPSTPPVTTPTQPLEPVLQALRQLPLADRSRISPGLAALLWQWMVITGEPVAITDAGSGPLGFLGINTREDAWAYLTALNHAALARRVRLDTGGDHFLPIRRATWTPAEQDTVQRWLSALPEPNALPPLTPDLQVLADTQLLTGLLAELGPLIEHLGKTPKVTGIKAVQLWVSLLAIPVSVRWQEIIDRGIGPNLNLTSESAVKLYRRTLAGNGLLSDSPDAVLSLVPDQWREPVQRWAQGLPEGLRTLILARIDAPPAAYAPPAGYAPPPSVLTPVIEKLGQYPQVKGVKAVLLWAYLPDEPDGIRIDEIIPRGIGDRLKITNPETYYFYVYALGGPLLGMVRAIGSGTGRYRPVKSTEWPITAGWSQADHDAVAAWRRSLPAPAPQPPPATPARPPATAPSTATQPPTVLAPIIEELDRVEHASGAGLVRLWIELLATARPVSVTEISDGEIGSKLDLSRRTITRYVSELLEVGMIREVFPEVGPVLVEAVVPLRWRNLVREFANGQPTDVRERILNAPAGDTPPPVPDDVAKGLGEDPVTRLLLWAYLLPREVRMSKLLAERGKGLGLDISRIHTHLQRLSWKQMVLTFGENNRNTVYKGVLPRDGVWADRVFRQRFREWAEQQPEPERGLLLAVIDEAWGGPGESAGGGWSRTGDGFGAVAVPSHPVQSAPNSTFFDTVMGRSDDSTAAPRRAESEASGVGSVAAVDPVDTEMSGVEGVGVGRLPAVAGAAVPGVDAAARPEATPPVGGGRSLLALPRTDAASGTAASPPVASRRGGLTAEPAAGHGVAPEAGAIIADDGSLAAMLGADPPPPPELAPVIEELGQHPSLSGVTAVRFWADLRAIPGGLAVGEILERKIGDRYGFTSQYQVMQYLQALDGLRMFLTEDGKLVAVEPGDWPQSRRDAVAAWTSRRFATVPPPPVPEAVGQALGINRVRRLLLWAVLTVIRPVNAPKISAGAIGRSLGLTMPTTGRDLRVLRDQKMVATYGWGFNTGRRGVLPRDWQDDAVFWQRFIGWAQEELPQPYRDQMLTRIAQAEGLRAVEVLAAGLAGVEAGWVRQEASDIGAQLDLLDGLVDGQAGEPHPAVAGLRGRLWALVADTARQVGVLGTGPGGVYLARPEDGARAQHIAELMPAFEGWFGLGAHFDVEAARFGLGQARLSVVAMAELLAYLPGYPARAVSLLVLGCAVAAPAVAGAVEVLHRRAGGRTLAAQDWLDFDSDHHFRTTSWLLLDTDGSERVLAGMTLNQVLAELGRAAPVPVPALVINPPNAPTETMSMRLTGVKDRDAARLYAERKLEDDVRLGPSKGFAPAGIVDPMAGPFGTDLQVNLARIETDPVPGAAPTLPDGQGPAGQVKGMPTWHSHLRLGDVDVARWVWRFGLSRSVSVAEVVNWVSVGDVIDGLQQVTDFAAGLTGMTPVRVVEGVGGFDKDKWLVSVEVRGVEWVKLLGRLVEGLVAAEVWYRLVAGGGWGWPLSREGVRSGVRFVERVHLPPSGWANWRRRLWADLIGASLAGESREVLKDVVNAVVGEARDGVPGSPLVDLLQTIQVRGSDRPVPGFRLAENRFQARDPDDGERGVEYERQPGGEWVPRTHLRGGATALEKEPVADSEGRNRSVVDLGDSSPQDRAVAPLEQRSSKAPVVAPIPVHLPAGNLVYVPYEALSLRTAVLDWRLAMAALRDYGLPAWLDPDAAWREAESGGLIMPAVAVLRLGRDAMGLLAQDGDAVAAPADGGVRRFDFIYFRDSATVLVQSKYLNHLTIESVSAGPGQPWRAPDEFVAAFEEQLAKRNREDLASRHAAFAGDAASASTAHTGPAPALPADPATADGRAGLARPGWRVQRTGVVDNNVETVGRTDIAGPLGETDFQVYLAHIETHRDSDVGVAGSPAPGPSRVGENPGSALVTSGDGDVQSEPGSHTDTDLVGLLRALQAPGQVDYRAVIDAIHSATTDQRQEALADPAVRSAIRLALPPGKRVAVVAAMLEGSFTWEQIPDDFLHHYSTPGSGTLLPFTASLDCVEFRLYVEHLAGLIGRASIERYVAELYSPEDRVGFAMAWEAVGWRRDLPSYHPDRAPEPGQQLFYVPDPPEGVIVLNPPGYPDHVAFSLGGDQAISLWKIPNGITWTQRITVTDIPGTVYVGDVPQDPPVAAGQVRDVFPPRDGPVGSVREAVDALVKAPEGSFMQEGGPDLGGLLGGMEEYPAAHAVYTSAFLTPEQVGRLERTLEAPEDATTPFDPDVVLPGPVVLHAEADAPPMPEGHNARVVFWLNPVETAAKDVDGRAVIPAGTRMRVEDYVPAGTADGVAVWILREVRTSQAPFDWKAYRRIEQAVLLRKEKDLAGEGSEYDPVVRYRLHNVMGGLMARFGIEVEFYTGKLHTGDPQVDRQIDAERDRMNTAVGQELFAEGLTKSPVREDDAARHRPYTDEPDDSRFMVEGYGSELASRIMKDYPQDWRRFFLGLRLIKKHGGVPMRNSNGNVHVGIPNFGGRPDAPDVAAANRLVHLEHNYMDVLYRLAYYWEASKQVDFMNNPLVPWLTDLGSGRPGRAFGTNFDNVSGGKDDHVEFRGGSPTHRPGALQAYAAIMVGLMVLAYRGGSPPTGSTPQRLGVNFTRELLARAGDGKKPVVTGDEDPPAPGSGEAAFIELVNLLFDKFEKQTDVHEQVAEMFATGQWRELNDPRIRLKPLAQEIYGRPLDPAADMPVLHNLHDLIRQARLQGLLRSPSNWTTFRNWLDDLAEDVFGIAGENETANLRTLASAVKRRRDELGYGNDLDVMLTLDQVHHALWLDRVAAGAAAVFYPLSSGEADLRAVRRLLSSPVFLKSFQAGRDVILPRLLALAGEVRAMGAPVRPRPAEDWAAAADVRQLGVALLAAAAERGPAEDIRLEDLARHWVSPLAPYTLALLPDESTIVLRSAASEARTAGEVTIFDTVAPDGKSRGRFEARIEEDGDAVVVSGLRNVSDAVGLVELRRFVKWFATERSAKPVFVERDSASAGGDRRNAAAVNQVERRGLKSSGWTLGAARPSGQPVTLVHPWTSSDSKWAPVDPDGVALQVVFETLDDGSQRLVAGRPTNASTVDEATEFAVVNPRSGATIATLRAQTGPPGRQRAAEGPVAVPAVTKKWIKLRSEEDMPAGTSTGAGEAAPGAAGSVAGSAAAGSVAGSAAGSAAVGAVPASRRPGMRRVLARLSKVARRLGVIGRGKAYLVLPPIEDVGWEEGVSAAAFFSARRRPGESALVGGVRMYRVSLPPDVAVRVDPAGVPGVHAEDVAAAVAGGKDLLVRHERLRGLRITKAYRMGSAWLEEEGHHLLDMDVSRVHRKKRTGDINIRLIGRGLGLASEAGLDWFKDYRRPEQWEGLSDELLQKRADSLASHLGIPPPTVVPTDSNDAEFARGPWTMSQDRSLPGLDVRDDFAHEMRHAEVGSLVARLVAGWGGADGVRRYVTTNEGVVQWAIGDPATNPPIRFGDLKVPVAGPLWPDDPKYPAAVEWFLRDYGPGGPQRTALNAVRKETQARLDELLEQYLTASTTGAPQARLVELKSALFDAGRERMIGYLLYRRISIEGDAFVVEELLRQRWPNPNPELRVTATTLDRAPGRHPRFHTQAGVHLSWDGTVTAALAAASTVTAQRGMPRLSIDPEVTIVDEVEHTATVLADDAFMVLVDLGRAGVMPGWVSQIPGVGSVKQRLSAEQVELVVEHFSGWGPVAVPVALLQELPALSGRVWAMDGSGRRVVTADYPDILGERVLTDGRDIVEYIFFAESLPTPMFLTADPVPGPWNGQPLDGERQGAGGVGFVPLPPAPHGFEASTVADGWWLGPTSPPRQVFVAAASPDSEPGTLHLPAPGDGLSDAPSLTAEQVADFVEGLVAAGAETPSRLVVYQDLISAAMSVQTLWAWLSGLPEQLRSRAWVAVGDDPAQPADQWYASSVRAGGILAADVLPPPAAARAEVRLDRGTRPGGWRRPEAMDVAGHAEHVVPPKEPVSADETAGLAVVLADAIGAGEPVSAFDPRAATRERRPLREALGDWPFGTDGAVLDEEKDGFAFAYPYQASPLTRPGTESAAALREKLARAQAEAIRGEPVVFSVDVVVPGGRLVGTVTVEAAYYAPRIVAVLPPRTGKTGEMNVLAYDVEYRYTGHLSLGSRTAPEVAVIVTKPLGLHVVVPTNTAVQTIAAHPQAQARYDSLPPALAQAARRLPADSPAPAPARGAWLSPVEREAYRLRIRGGLLYTAGGARFETAGAAAPFVMLEDGRLYASTDGRSHREQLRGDRFAAVGLLVARKDEPVRLTDDSEEFQPPWHFLDQTVAELRSQGVALAASQVTHRSRPDSLMDVLRVNGLVPAGLWRAPAPADSTAIAAQPDALHVGNPPPDGRWHDRPVESRLSLSVAYAWYKVLPSWQRPTAIVFHQPEAEAFDGQNLAARFGLPVTLRIYRPSQVWNVIATAITYFPRRPDGTTPWPQVEFPPVRRWLRTPEIVTPVDGRHGVFMLGVHEGAPAHIVEIFPSGFMVYPATLWLSDAARLALLRFPIDAGGVMHRLPGSDDRQVRRLLTALKDEFRPKVPAEVLAARHPELISKPRTYREMSARLGELGYEAPFEVVEPLRVRSHEAAHRAAPALSKETWEALLADIWARQLDIIAGRVKVSELLRTRVSAHPLAMSREAYTDQILAIAEDLPPGSTVKLQRAGYKPLSEATPEEARSASYISFGRSGGTSPTRARLYVTSRPDATPALMRELAREVIYNPGRFLDVHRAKVSGADRVSTRRAAIVVYGATEEAVDAVVGWLGGYRLAHPDAFEDPTPGWALQVMTGVAKVSDGLAALDRSVSKHRIKVIKEAFSSAVRFGGGLTALMDGAWRGLERDGLNPDAPHANLPQDQLESRPRESVSDSLAELAAELPAYWAIGERMLQARLDELLAELSDTPGVGVFVVQPTLLESGELRERLRAVSGVLQSMALANDDGQTKADGLAELVADLLLAGVVSMGRQPFVPHALLLRALDQLALDPDGLLRHLGYPVGATISAPDEYFAHRLARFGLLHLPAYLADQVVASPLSVALIDSPRLAVTLVASASPDTTGRAGTVGSGEIGAVPIAALVEVLHTVASNVERRLSDASDHDLARQRVAEARAVKGILLAEALQVAQDSDASSLEILAQVRRWIDQVERALQRLAELGLWAFIQRPDSSSVPVVGTSSAAPPLAVGGYFGPESEVDLGLLLAHLRGDLAMQEWAELRSMGDWSLDD